jgi:nitrogen fixation protein FixH
MQRKGTLPTPRRELTGRTVLLCLVAFFAVVAGVNAVMIRFATSTFGGVETSSAYKAGLAYKSEIAAARAQDALNWRVDGRMTRNHNGTALLTVNVADAEGRPLSDVRVRARATHPMDSRMDHEFELSSQRAGQFQGKDDTMASGQWTLVIDVLRDGERLFRSKSRVVLQ